MKTNTLTPSVLNNILAAWKNLVLSDCIFVLTVSNGWDMNILQAPEEKLFGKCSNNYGNFVNLNFGLCLRLHHLLVEKKVDNI